MTDYWSVSKCFPKCQTRPLAFVPLGVVDTHARERTRRLRARAVGGVEGSPRRRASNRAMRPPRRRPSRFRRRARRHATEAHFPARLRPEQLAPRPHDPRPRRRHAPPRPPPGRSARGARARGARARVVQRAGDSRGALPSDPPPFFSLLLRRPPPRAFSSRGTRVSRRPRRRARALARHPDPRRPPPPRPVPPTISRRPHARGRPPGTAGGRRSRPTTNRRSRPTTNPRRTPARCASR